MSKLKKGLMVLQLLNQYEKLTGQELAEKVQTSERNIRKIYQELTQIGIPIETIKGRKVGGYTLNREGFKTFFNINKKARKKET